MIGSSWATQSSQRRDDGLTSQRFQSQMCPECSESFGVNVIGWVVRPTYLAGGTKGSGCGKSDQLALYMHALSRSSNFGGYRTWSWLCYPTPRSCPDLSNVTAAGEVRWAIQRVRRIPSESTCRRSGTCKFATPSLFTLRTKAERWTVGRTHRTAAETTAATGVYLISLVMSLANTGRVPG